MDPSRFSHEFGIGLRQRWDLAVGGEVLKSSHVLARICVYSSVSDIKPKQHIVRVECTSESKSKSHILCSLWGAFNKTLGILSHWKMKRWISSFPKPHGNLLFVNLDIFHFKVYSNVSTWTVDQTALSIKFHLHVGIKIRVRLEKGWKVAVSYRSESIAYIFIQSNLWLYVDQRSHLFLIEVSSSVEILQSWGKMVAQWLLIWGLKLVLHVPCCSPALGICDSIQ